MGQSSQPSVLDPALPEFHPVAQMASSRKTLIYLILTLNHMYPDYDFSTLRAHHFTKEASIAGVKQKLNDSLMEASKVWAATEGDDSSSLLEMLWSVIDEVIELVDTDVYSYKSDLLEGDPFGETGNLWSFNYFFYNRKLKRILYFSCKSVRNGWVCGAIIIQSQTLQAWWPCFPGL
eukprot:jgi/Mesvir1/25545/Mv01787-RA.1